METLSKSDTAQDKELCPPPAASAAAAGSLSASSYKDYPAQRPFINTRAHHPPRTRMYHSYRPLSPSKAFPENSSEEILSALRNLQEKIRRLELGKGPDQLGLTEASGPRLQSDKVTRGLSETTGAGRDASTCNHALIGQLAAAESRCVKLERQLELTRRMLRHAKADRTNLLKEQVSMETTRSAAREVNPPPEDVQMEKLERLEQEYLRLTRTQTDAEMKIRALEIKLQEEEHQRKLIQEKANQLQTGLEANRILLQSVSPRLSRTQPKDRQSNSKKRAPQQTSFVQPHYRLSLSDVPFVVGMSAGCSHSVRANIQSVLSLLKRHQPRLCNKRVPSHRPSASESTRHRRSDSSSSSSSSGGDELSELLQTLREELRLMSMEQDELTRRLAVSVSDQERKALQREQERLLVKMEKKGEQISKLYKYRTQVKRVRREANSRWDSPDEARATTTASSRGRSAAAHKLRPGERSRRNLRLLRDMKELQNSLRT